MKIQFRKASVVKQLITAILKSESLSFEERKSVKEAKRALEDATTGCEIHLQCAQETYSEMKNHKVFIEDSERTKNILKAFQDDRDLILVKEIELSFKPINFDFNFSKDGEKANDFKSIALELEDILFVYPKK